MNRDDVEDTIFFIKNWEETDKSSIVRKIILDNALEALEKQVPKKPEKIENKYEWHCPTCKSFLCDWSYIFRSDYCPACGQALDWEADDGT